jgi:uncharacterized protein YaaR (DUF327 family)
MSDFHKLEEIINGMINAAKEITNPDLINKIMADADVSDLKEIIYSIETNKSFKSLDEHKSRLKEKNLSYDELLCYAAEYSEWIEVLEFENDNLKKVQAVYDKLLSWNDALLDHQQTHFDVVTTFDEAKALLSSKRNFAEGSIAGRDAQKRIMAKKGALAKTASDPKQKEKSFVYGCWEKWQANPGNYKSKANFARDMLDKCEHLTSTKKIEDWCREWENKNGTQPAK